MQRIPPMDEEARKELDQFIEEQKELDQFIEEQLYLHLADNPCILLTSLQLNERII